MKNIFNKTFITIAAMSMLGATACNKIKDFGDTNQNPNGTPTPITKGMLTRAIAELGGREGQNLSVTTYTRPGYYTQYFSETQYPESSLYGVPQLEFSNNYTGLLMDLQNIINLNSNPSTAATVASSGSNANQIAIARILKAYAFWTITDRWGDIPYSEALTGKTTLPKYDLQENIYKDLIKELKEAVDGFDGGQPMYGDVIYQGNIGNWKKLANSLRMQVALRMSKVYPDASGFAATEFKAALNHTAGSITSNSENATIDYDGSAYQNPWYVSYVVNKRIDDALSSTMADRLNALNDPRIYKYGEAAPGQKAVGFPYGIKRDKAVQVPIGWSLVLGGKGISPSTENAIMTAATSLLARAEAAERGWTGENAGNLYNQGVTAGLTQYGFADKAAAYLGNPDVDFGAADHLMKIGIQKWIAVYPDGIQGWAEWRRTGFPTLTPAVDATNKTKQIPRRFVYGVAEYGSNNTNVKEAAARMGADGDSQDSRIWWDKQ